MEDKQYGVHEKRREKTLNTWCNKYELILLMSV